MKSVIVKSFEFICKIGVVALILTGGAIGYGSGQAYGYGVAGAISGVCGGAILSIIIFGILFILIDIRDNTQKTALAISTVNQGE